jgi:hypothetical protein
MFSRPARRRGATDVEVVAKAERRRFTAEYSSGHETDGTGSPRIAARHVGQAIGTPCNGSPGPVTDHLTMRVQH